MVMPRKHLFSFQTNHYGTVRITKNNSCSHINQLIYKKQTAFKHFLMNQYRAFGLYGSYQNNT